MSTTLPDGTRVDAIKETTYHNGPLAGTHHAGCEPSLCRYADGRISTTVTPIEQPKSSQYSDTAQRGGNDKHGIAERQAVTRAAHLAVEEERLGENLQKLEQFRDATQAKHDDCSKQLEGLRDPAQADKVAALQDECKGYCVRLCRGSDWAGGAVSSKLSLCRTMSHVTRGSR